MKNSTAMVALALATASGLVAQDGPTYKFSGFGTLAATHSSEKKADFISNFGEPTGAGFSRNTDFGLDSRLGIQGDFRLNESWSAVLQVVSERRYDDTYTPYVGMGFVKYQASGLSFRVGRLPYAAYLISDFKRVGYAQPWVRPPVEVYQFNPLASVDGLDVTWQFNLGQYAVTTQIVAGNSRADLPPSASAVRFAAPGTTPRAEWKSDDMGAISVVVNRGSATFRAFHAQMKGTYSDPGFDGPTGPIAGMSPFVALRTLPAAFGGNRALADQFEIVKDKVTYDSVSFNYDPGSWFLMVEGTRKRGDENLFLHFTAGFATLGVRLGNWTPYATGGWKHTDSPTTNANPIINAVVSGMDRSQTSLSAGLRWDFRKNMALKAQYDAVKHPAGAIGVLTNLQPGFKAGESYNVSTIALDFVF